MSLLGESTIYPPTRALSCAGANILLWIHLSQTGSTLARTRIVRSRDTQRIDMSAKAHQES